MYKLLFLLSIFFMSAQGQYLPPAARVRLCETGVITKEKMIGAEMQMRNFGCEHITFKALDDNYVIGWGVYYLIGE